MSTNRYSVRRSIRDTIYGKVHLGKDSLTQKTIIIKQCGIYNVTNHISTNDIPVEEDVFAEIRIHKWLTEDENISPYVIKQLDVVQDDENIFIVLEFAPKGELFQFVDSRKRRAPAVEEKEPATHRHEIDARKYMPQLAAGVSYIHGKFIAHRDLSLENLLLDENLNLKIIDFGVAIGGEDSTFAHGDWRAPSGRVGKTQYMAPEVFGGIRYDARAADIWSMGVIFFILLVGYPPYEYPHVADPRFKLIIEGKLHVLLAHWKLGGVFSDPAVDLVQRMLSPENSRITMDALRVHPFFD